MGGKRGRELRGGKEIVAGRGRVKERKDYLFLRAFEFVSTFPREPCPAAGLGMCVFSGIN